MAWAVITKNGFKEIAIGNNTPSIDRDFFYKQDCDKVFSQIANIGDEEKTVNGLRCIKAEIKLKGEHEFRECRVLVGVASGEHNVAGIFQDTLLNEVGNFIALPCPNYDNHPVGGQELKLEPDV